jgi:hypothetical protein
VLKGLATKLRSGDADVADFWRCLEIAFAADVGPENFASGVRADSAEVIRCPSAPGSVVGLAAVPGRPGIDSRQEGSWVWLPSVDLGRNCLVKSGPAEDPRPGMHGTTACEKNPSDL